MFARAFCLVLAASVAACAPTIIDGPRAPFVERNTEAPAAGRTVTVSVGEVMASRERVSSRRGARVTGNGGQEIALVEVNQSGVLWYCDVPNLFCFRDSDGDGLFDTIRSGPSTPPMQVLLASNPNFRAAYRLTDDAVLAQNSFRMQLLYQGVDGRTVRLSYREFSNDLARPAFQQDLTYNLAANGPTAVSFRGLQMQIHSADNNGITYQVVRSFSDRT